MANKLSRCPVCGGEAAHYALKRTWISCDAQDFSRRGSLSHACVTADTELDAILAWEALAALRKPEPEPEPEPWTITLPPPTPSNPEVS